ncbi:hypothetical protein V8G57_24550 [Collimonas sp. H4R21]|uniref:Uncharacterized protein n=1 Tax=Collimonas rhizosphaerae TaxID=3126357 RepID=A0ABU9Q2U9_9BURK
MNCVSTPDQIATTLPRPQGLLGGLFQAVKNTDGWWQQRLVPPQPAAAPPAEEKARYVLNIRDLSDHLLRDIGYIDSVQPREQVRRDTIY